MVGSNGDVTRVLEHYVKLHIAGGGVFDMSAPVKITADEISYLREVASAFFDMLENQNGASKPKVETKTEIPTKGNAVATSASLPRPMPK